MNLWPQYSVIAWLTIATASALATATTKRLPWMVVFDRKQQRLMGAGFAIASISEAFLLWQGGFFQGLL